MTSFVFPVQVGPSLHLGTNLRTRGYLLLYNIKLSIGNCRHKAPRHKFADTNTNLRHPAPQPEIKAPFGPPDITATRQLTLFLWCNGALTYIRYQFDGTIL
jgi:hypothetical protein